MYLAPPELGPKYVATYIRDLSVDTLQIANNAVTVPLSAQYGAMSSYVGQGTETVVGTPLTVDFGTNVPTQVFVDGVGVIFNRDLEVIGQQLFLG